MIAGCSVAGGTGRLCGCSCGCDWGCGWAGAAERFWQGTSLVDFIDHHPSPLLCVLLCFCKWGNAVPISIFHVTCLGITMAQGIAAILGCSSVLMVGARCGDRSRGELASPTWFQIDSLRLILHWAKGYPV